MRVLTIALLSSSIAVACSHHRSPNGDDDNNDTAGPDAAIACGSDADCPTGEQCDPTSGTCLGGCGAQHLNLTYVPPNLGIVLDRSCSMTKELKGSDETKWEAAVGALTDVLTTYSTKVRWGMTMFPDNSGSACTQDAIPFPIADNNAQPIAARLQAALGSGDPDYPDFPCVTPIDTGIEQAGTDPALLDTTRKSYLMLVTDGAQAGCSAGGSAAGAEAAVTQLFSQGVATYVVGFGSEVDGKELTTLANDGGVPNTMGSNAYYAADTAAELDSVFQQIASNVVSCTYAVDQTPPDLDETYVVFSGNTLVPRDQTHMDGWDYDPSAMTLTLYGNYCSELETGVVVDFDVLFGCPTPPIF
jgi:hypothetical protein